MIGIFRVCDDCSDMKFTIDLPTWAIDQQERLPESFPSLEERMQVVIDFARQNFQQGTGGPFAAGVFERETGKRIVLGVNRVVPCNASSAHAEIVALSLAQQRLGSWDLGGADLPAMQMVVNWRPCAMCYGATIWSGIRSLVIAGCDDACEKITGFDEGPIHPEWIRELKRRGIELIDGILYDQAIEVFQAFRDGGYLVYNGRRGLNLNPDD